MQTSIPGLPLCQECLEMSGNWKVLPKSHENVRKFLWCVKWRYSVFYVFCSMWKKFECEIKA